ncbi:HD-GYP domain-containing protein [Marinitoga sp. 38H-ov]|uniref:HD-GYP domain-containing protein n=1 Tax=Marinitoga sp. 38H-ov TaxID=1755814 RepID=UPI0013EE1004|nr:HD-GYP domain-containing protein [Marinitoga sp. 38H-ov]KAF2955194.1 hypothetical protein AS160_01455 [Marinitoga sp. 38H-ov]
MHFELSQNVIDNIPKLISLLESISNETYNMDDFYNELLKTAISIIPEADYGSLILINNDSWNWLAAIGHDNNILKKMSFKIKNDDLIDGNVIIYNDVLEYRKKLMHKYVYETLKKATIPIKSTMAYHLKINDNLWIQFSLDIAKESQKTFSEDSKETLKLFGNLAKIFLKNKIEKDKIIELNKELKIKNYQLLEINKKMQRMYENTLDIINNMNKITRSIKDDESLIINVFNTLVKIIPFVEKALLVEKKNKKVKIKEKIGFGYLTLKELSIKEIKNNIIEFIELDGYFVQTKFEDNIYILLKIEKDENYELFNVYNINESLEKLIHSFSELKENLKSSKEFTKKVIRTFVNLSDLNGVYKMKHSEKTAYYANIIGKEMGFSKEKLDNLYCASLMHDIGKIGIPPNILVKTTTLTPEEYEIVKRHTIIGYDIIMKYLEDEKLARIVKYHHERYDGKGYPEGLKGEEIPIESRIISVADSFSEMLEEKSYRKNLSREKAINVLKDNKGTQFDPMIVEIFVKFLGENQ